MAELRIYPNEKEFKKRKDKSINGCTQKWLDENNLGYNKVASSLIRCKGCFNCYTCKRCKYCEYCEYCEYCSDCIRCKYCDFCDDCDDCFSCEDCADCGNCDDCRNGDGYHNL